MKNSLGLLPLIIFSLFILLPNNSIFSQDVDPKVVQLNKKVIHADVNLIGYYRTITLNYERILGQSNESRIVS